MFHSLVTRCRFGVVFFLLSMDMASLHNGLLKLFVSFEIALVSFVSTRSNQECMKLSIETIQPSHRQRNRLVLFKVKKKQNDLKKNLGTNYFFHSGDGKDFDNFYVGLVGMDIAYHLHWVVPKHDALVILLHDHT